MRRITPSVLRLAMEQTREETSRTSSHVTRAMSQVAVARHVTSLQPRDVARGELGTADALRDRMDTMDSMSMSITRLGFCLAVALAGCVDDVDDPIATDPTAEREPDEEGGITDEPLPEEETCGAREKADGPCLP